MSVEIPGGSPNNARLCYLAGSRGLAAAWVGEGLTTLVRQHFAALPKGDAAPVEQAPSTHARIALQQ